MQNANFRNERQMEPRRPLLPGIVIISLAKCYLGRIVSRKHERDLRGDPPIVLPITEINAVDLAVVARRIGFMTSRNIGVFPFRGYSWNHLVAAVNFIKLLFRLAPLLPQWPIMGCPMEKWRWLIRAPRGTRGERDSGRRHLSTRVSRTIAFPLIARRDLINSRPEQSAWLIKFSYWKPCARVKCERRN